MTYEYFLTEKAPQPGAIPSGYELIGTNKFDKKTYIPSIGCDAYGTVFFRQKLPEEDIKRYKLKEGKRW